MALGFYFTPSSFAPSVYDDVLGRLERQVEDGEREHHLGEVARGIREVLGEEGAVAGVLRVVVPERADGDQLGNLRADRQVVVVVLGPLLRRVEFAVQLPHLLQGVSGMKLVRFLP